jgi:putative NIF3 family GTP cyclohydrolase 1 type 2
MSIERREFIGAAMSAAATALLAIPGFSMAAGIIQPNKDYTVQEIIDLILKEVPGAPFSQTVDTIKSGKPDQKVTGIVTTMFATVDVIKQAAVLGANFIIAHEPTYYNHADKTDWVTPNEVLKQKMELLDRNKIAVWRFHDYWHSVRPDGIMYGVIKKAKWLQYYQQDKRIVTIPGITLKDLALHLKTTLGIAQVRVIGDLTQKCERIALSPGAAGSESQVAFAEKEKPDVLIVGETREWETAEYIRDSQLLGNKTALIVLGHSVSEEPGMEWLVDWLQPKVPGMKITHIASGNPFTFV